MDLSLKSKTEAASRGGGGDDGRCSHGDGGRGNHGDGRRGSHGNKRRAQISIMEKVRIIERFRSGESASNISASCGIGQSTVCEITQAEAEIMQTLRLRGPVYCETHYQVSWPHYGRLEHPLRQWLTSLPPEQLPVDPTVIQKEAGRIAEELGLKGFIPSKSWMNRFHKKNWKYCGNRSRGQESSSSTRGRSNSKKESAQGNHRPVALGEDHHPPRPSPPHPHIGTTGTEYHEKNPESQIYRSGNPDVPEVSSQVHRLHQSYKTGESHSERRIFGQQCCASQPVDQRPNSVCDGTFEHIVKDIRRMEKKRRRRRGAKSLEQIAKEILSVNGELTLVDLGTPPLTFWGERDEGKGIGEKTLAPSFKNP